MPPSDCRPPVRTVVAKVSGTKIGRVGGGVWHVVGRFSIRVHGRRLRGLDVTVATLVGPMVSTRRSARSLLPTDAGDAVLGSDDIPPGSNTPCGDRAMWPTLGNVGCRDMLLVDAVRW